MIERARALRDEVRTEAERHEAEAARLWAFVAELDDFIDQPGRDPGGGPAPVAAVTTAAPATTQELENLYSSTDAAGDDRPAGEDGKDGGGRPAPVIAALASSRPNGHATEVRAPAATFRCVEPGCPGGPFRSAAGLGAHNAAHRRARRAAAEQPAQPAVPGPAAAAGSVRGGVTDG